MSWRSLARWILFWERLIGKNYSVSIEHMRCIRIIQQNLFLISVVLMILAGSEARAQSCHLTVNLRAENSEGVTNFAKAVLVSVDEPQSFWGVPNGQKSLFQNIPAGNYTLILRQPNFMTTIGSLSVTCGKSPDERSVYVHATQCSGNPINVFNEGSITSRILERDPNKFTMMGSVEFICQHAQKEKLLASPKTPVRYPFPKQISGGVLNGKALSLPRPAYPPAARAIRASGAVSVKVLIDEDGNVVSASAVSGHPLLQAAAVAEARAAKFSPTQLEGQPVKVSGVITYNFVP